MNKILTEELNDINQIFEKYYTLFTSLKTRIISSKEKNDISIKSEEFLVLLTKLERKIQDISENIDAENEFIKDNKYSLSIEYTKILLENWFKEILNHSQIDLIIELIGNEKIIDFLHNTVNKLYNFLNSFYFNKGSNEDIKRSFKQNFGIYMDENNVVTLTSMFDKYSNEVIFEEINHFQYLAVKESIKEVVIENLNIEDSENVLYVGSLEIWIDTNDAAEANRFMYLISSILSNIQNVDLNIEEVKIGSYFQKLGLKIKGWFAKEEVQQVLTKGIEAAEAYSMDRHIEPIKKSQIERKKTEEEIDRMMPKEMVEDLQKIQIETAKAELETKKLANLEKKIAIANSLTEALKNGLLSVDSDYRISLNGVLLIEQTENNIKTNKNIEGIDIGYRKELLNEKMKIESDQAKDNDEEIVEIPKE